ncbi:hypothetical protein EJ06DRAFT_556720 [Trichodelitschia bisporula]|uniref:BAH domain-containing protein n=1 Tax=Trichodelitschia bisporula TaxID=703511 RepID=A0A6G1HWH6_9PEZI|nr:hypothetical protein EJ06DRAFT_556720 [Trichodelitschia bisporula]
MARMARTVRDRRSSKHASSPEESPPPPSPPSAGPPARRRRVSTQQTPASASGAASAPPEGDRPQSSHKKAFMDWSAIEEDQPFKINFYDKAPPKKRKRDETAPACLDAPFTAEFNAYYSISPAKWWEDAPKYKRFTIYDETFQVGEYVLVKTEEANLPEGKAETGLSPLADILKGRWVAHVLEVRAGDEQHVYLRVLWMYRPEDLPGGRKPWHGSYELIASNYMQVINAMSVDGRVPVKHWVENYDLDSDPNDPEADELFYRSTVDFLRPSASSYLPVHKHCKCDTPANPDNLLIRCENCQHWLHAECICRAATTLMAKELDAPISVSNSTNARNSGSGRGRRPSGRPSTAAALPHISISKSEPTEGGKSGYELTGRFTEDGPAVWKRDASCLFCEVPLE